MPAQTLPIGPWPKGMQNIFDATAVPKGCLMEAVNVDLTPAGAAEQRRGYSSVGTNVHSLFQFGPHTYGVVNGMLAEIYELSARSFGMAIDAPVTWGTLLNMPVFTNTSVLGVIDGEDARELGMDAPSVTSGGGSAPPEEYLAGATFVDKNGAESALSAVVRSKPGDTLGISGGAGGRVYMTRKNSEVLYDIGAYAEGATMYKIPDMPPYGKQCESQYLSRLPGGHYVRYWRGRLLIARGRKLYISMPMRYGVYDANAGFVKFEGKIDWIESIESGVFVAVTGQGVYYLGGDEPAKWERKLVDTVRSQPGCVTIIPTVQLRALNLPSPAAWAAVWLTDKGFALGLAGGMVVYPQADRLSGLPLGAGTLQFRGDRLIALSQ